MQALRLPFRDCDSISLGSRPRHHGHSETGGQDTTPNLDNLMTCELRGGKNDMTFISKWSCISLPQYLTCSRCSRTGNLNFSLIVWRKKHCLQTCQYAAKNWWFSNVCGGLLQSSHSLKNTATLSWGRIVPSLTCFCAPSGVPNFEHLTMCQTLCVS